MPLIDAEEHKRLQSAFAQMLKERDSWTSHWQECARHYLPRRYVWLDKGRRQGPQRNNNILDNSGTLAARTLASGMMSGITNPSRQWFNLRIPSFGNQEPLEVKSWLDETRRRLLVLMGGTNYYNAMAQVYLDIAIFGTAAVLIYEDYENVFRCYNCALGEFLVAQSDRRVVDTFARSFEYTPKQIVQRWGNDPESVPRFVLEAYNNQVSDTFKVRHLIEPNYSNSDHKYQETYWVEGAKAGLVLSKGKFFDLPLICPRWDVVGNDSYGHSPGMDALGDVIQLQHMNKRKAQALDVLVRPPIVADVQLKNKPTALMPGGVTYVSGNSQVRAQPAYQINPPVQEIMLDIQQVQGRIRETFHNDLFRMISQLETVRSATEIDARREEKLVLLGPTLERFENEALSPSIQRIFSIASRSGLIEPPPPAILEGDEVEIEYVSVLSDAQKAVSTLPIERFLNILGPVSAFDPSARNVANVPELLREYGEAINLPPSTMRSREETNQLGARDNMLQELSQTAQVGEQMSDVAKTLSETDVGGGVNALARALGQ